MELELIRFVSKENATLGALYRKEAGSRKFLCFTLEDEYRKEKVHGHTRIPAGTYELKLRKVGGFHTRYALDPRFKDIHKGMLWLQNVPGFEYVLMHCGNKPEDTEGCLLLGDHFTSSTQTLTLGGSGDAYKRNYPAIADAILRGERVTITLSDFA